MQKVLNAIQRVRFNESTIRSIRDKKKPSLGKINVKVRHQRSPYAMKFEDRSHEETEQQQRCAEARHGTLPQTFTSSKRKTKLHSSRLQKSGFSPSASARELEEREFVVDSGASMHMVSKEDLNSAELETVTASRSPTTVMTVNGEVQTRQEATVFVKELDLFVTVVPLQETPAVLSLEKLCEEHGYMYHLKKWSKSTSHPKWQQN